MNHCALCGESTIYGLAVAKSGRSLCANPVECWDRWQQGSFAQSRAQARSRGAELSTKQYVVAGGS